MGLMKKGKDLLKKIFGWCRSHKFLTIVIVVGLISAAGFAINRKMLFDTMASQQQTSYSFVRTTTLQKNGLEQSVNATGSVESANTSTISYSSQGGNAAKVKTINVAVGDTVKEGDVVVVLDTTDIQESIEKEEEALAEKVEKALANYNTATESYNTAVSSYNSSVTAVSDAKTKRDAAQKEYENAAASISNFQKAYDDAVAAEAKAVKEYNAALADYQTKYSAAKANYDAAKTNYDAAKTNYDAAAAKYEQALKQQADEGDGDTLATDSGTEETVDTEALKAAAEQAKSKLDEAEITMNTAQQKLSEIEEPQKNYEEAQKATKEAHTALNSAKSSVNYDSYYSAYTQAQSSYEAAQNTRDQLKTKMEQAKEAVDTAYENYIESQTSETLEDLKEQLADCNLKAETGGKITSLNATVGGAANGTIAQIMDTDSLKISITISEGDINDVAIGMKCKIRSDATEVEINGTLTQIDPISSMGGSFGAEVTVDDKDTGLIIGMNADVDIIISTTDDCFTVPIDAVGNDEDGLGSYVYRKTGGEGVDMEFEKVYVTTGESNDYYIEIDADTLSTGDVIRSYADLTVGVEEVTGEDAQSAMGLESLLGGLGNMGGGDMPSGNGGGDREMPSGNGGNMGGGNMPGGNGGFGGGGQ